MILNRLLDWISGKGIVAKIELRKGARSKSWHWVSVGHNGETLCSSEEYATRDKCLQTAEQVARQLWVEVR